MDYSDVRDRKVLIMGLGAHGGGAASARFFAERGAEVTVTDLRNSEQLQRSVESLDGLPIRFVLGEHEAADFRASDLVIKNPAVPRTSSYLGEAGLIETDISVFLSLCRGPVVGITGSKGKSTTSSMLHHILVSNTRDAQLGGNITISPLSFVDSLSETTVTVLELSSFQLGDLPLTESYRARATAPFAGVAITNLLPDHQDYYASMESYAADKSLIFERQTPATSVLLSAEDPYSRRYTPPYPEQTLRLKSTGAEIHALSADTGEIVDIDSRLLPDHTALTGSHSRRNAFMAALLALRLGVDEAGIRRALATFPGVPHRLESIAMIAGVRYVNDSAATIQEATLAAVDSFQGGIHLIAGGSDKGLPIDLFHKIARRVRTLHLLAGTGSERILTLLQSTGQSYTGPHDSLQAAFDSASHVATDGEVVLLSPGCASFGMFRNEFDRGDQFRDLVHAKQKA